MKKEFNGVIYNDDRMFVLYLCQCTGYETEDQYVTTIHHTNVPENAIWSVVTFRNNERYTAYRADHFDNKQEAMEYIAEVEPSTPLISLGGNQPDAILAYDEYLRWKLEQGFEEYDYKKMYSPDAINPTENLYKAKN